MKAAKRTQISFSAAGCERQSAGCASDNIDLCRSAADHRRRKTYAGALRQFDRSFMRRRKALGANNDVPWRQFVAARATGGANVAELPLRFIN